MRPSCLDGFDGWSETVDLNGQLAEETLNETSYLRVSRGTIFGKTFVGSRVNMPGVMRLSYYTGREGPGPRRHEKPYGHRAQALGFYMSLQGGR